MRSILYISFMDLGKKGSVGVKKKIFSQLQVFQQNGYQVYYVYVDNGCLKTNFIQTSQVKNNLEHLKNSLSKIMYNCEFVDIDYVYIRFGAFSFDFLNMLKKIKKAKCYILMEIPTFPIIGEYRLKIKKAFNRKDFVSALGNCKIILTYPYFVSITKKYFDRIVTFSEDEKIWGVKTIRICNGVDTKNIPDIFYSTRNKKEITMICVSSCYLWHGYDRVIEGMRLYYEQDSSKNISVRLNIVGDGPELDNYKELVKRYKLEDYVVFWGKLVDEELDKVYKNSDVALDAMGRHRVGVYYNSTLKGKEYAMYGLPIVSGVRTELDKIEDFPFYLRVPADDSPIGIEEIIKFMENVEKYSDYHQQIRNYAITHFSYAAVMKPIIQYVNDQSDKT